jgi:hypothetical protein
MTGAVAAINHVQLAFYGFYVFTQEMKISIDHELIIQSIPKRGLFLHTSCLFLINVSKHSEQEMHQPIILTILQGTDYMHHLNSSCGVTPTSLVKVSLLCCSCCSLAWLLDSLNRC